MTSVVSFTKVRGPHGWLSNMSPHPITFALFGEPVTWRTAEALFQALRFDVRDPARELIRAQTSPMAAKMVAKRHVMNMTVTPRSAQDVFNMEFVLRCKLHEHPDLARKLLETGDAVIHEDVTRRPGGESAMFWGARSDLGDYWFGTSWLGRLWVELREELRRAPR